MNIFERIAKVHTEPFDAVLLTSPVNRRYVTHFPSSAGYVVGTEKHTTYFTDFRYYESAVRAQKDGVIPSDIEIAEAKGSVWEDIRERLSDAKDVLFEDGSVTVADCEAMRQKLSGYTLVGGLNTAMISLRRVKTEAELDTICRAQTVTDMAFSHIVGFLSDHLGKGLTEADVAFELEFFMRSHGAEGLAFDTIAVSGTKSALPHGVPADVPVGKGFLTMDFGARVDGYCSDMTRTVCIGKPDDKMRDVYDTVLTAQLKALDFIAAGKTGKEIDAVARDYIASRGYDGTFGHSLGHSLGLEIHERPNFSSGDTTVMPAGAVVSVEPGVYLAGSFGVRIEDIVNITQNGCKNLTKSPKELLIL